MYQTLLKRNNTHCMVNNFFLRLIIGINTDNYIPTGPFKNDQITIHNQFNLERRRRKITKYINNLSKTTL